MEATSEVARLADDDDREVGGKKLEWKIRKSALRITLEWEREDDKENYANEHRQQ
jgi:hypothetical protein